MGKSVSAIAAEFLRSHLSCNPDVEVHKVQHVDSKQSFCLELSSVEDYLAELEESGERLARYDILEDTEEERSVKVILQSATTSGKYFYGVKQSSTTVLWCYSKNLAFAVNVGPELDTLSKDLADRGYETIPEWAITEVK